MDSSETNAKEICKAIKNAISLQKSSFERKISSRLKLKELDQTLHERNWLAENIVEGNLGSLRNRSKYKLAPIYPMLERIMIKMTSSINKGLSLRMSKLHPVEVFNLLYKKIIIRTRYGIEVDEHANSVTITFKNDLTWNNLLTATLFIILVKFFPWIERLQLSLLFHLIGLSPIILQSRPTVPFHFFY